MKILIELNDAGQLLVNGDCLQNKVMAIGMLEMAKTMVVSQPMKPAAPPIEVPDGAMTNHLVGRNGTGNGTGRRHGG